MYSDDSSQEFSLPLRVYIEDTDAGGIVYYVNYLKFMERARTEFMRSRGFGRDSIFTAELMFVVESVDIRYRAPARLDDVIEATVAPLKIGAASLLLAQTVRRDGTLLADGQVRIGCVDKKTLKPKKMPADMLAGLRGERARLTGEG